MADSTATAFDQDGNTVTASIESIAKGLASGALRNTKKSAPVETEKPVKK